MWTKKSTKAGEGRSWAFLVAMAALLVMPAAAAIHGDAPGFEDSAPLGASLPGADAWARPQAWDVAHTAILDALEPAPTASLVSLAGLQLSGCRAHAGIRIEGDFGSGGFEWNNPLTGAREIRPGSGVTGGSGTEEDPYVIAGWCLPATGIHITGTSSHLVVRDNRVAGTGLSADDAGVRLMDVAHVTVVSNELRKLGYGVGAWRSTGVVIEGNLLEGNLRYGAWAAEIEGVELRNNTARGNENGLGVGLSPGALVEGNRLDGNQVAGFLNAFSDDITVRANHATGGEAGFYVREAFDVKVTENLLQGQSGNGVVFDQSTRGAAEKNTINAAGHEGIMFWFSPHGLAIGNTVTATGFLGDRYAIRMAASVSGTVAANVAEGNRNGFVLDGSVDGLVTGNLVSGSDVAGLILWASPDTRLVSNTVTANALGVQLVDDASGVEIGGNNLFANQGGIGLDALLAQGSPDAERNWWGCLRGPGEAGCDDFLGDVQVSKWLRQPARDAPGAPPPGAGASGPASDAE